MGVQEQITKIPIFKILHQCVRPAAKALGFKLETRRQGELVLGLWRKKWKTRSAFPKRLVVIPGLGDSPLSWVGVFSSLKLILKEPFDEIVLVDFPGFQGFLSDKKGFPSMDLLQRAIFDALDSLKPETVFGHSLGGWLAAAYAVECGLEKRPASRSGKYRGPTRIVLVNPSGLLIKEEDRSRWKKVFDELGKEGGKAYCRGLFSRTPRWFGLFSGELERFLRKPELGKFIESINEKHLLNDRLGVIRSETWVLWGDNDKINFTEWAPDWVRRIPQARGFFIRNSGHLPHFERPVEFFRLIGKILNHESVPRLDRGWKNI